MGTVDYIFDCIASDERALRTLDKAILANRKSIKLTNYGLILASVTFFCMNMELKNQRKQIDILKQKIDILQEEVVGPTEGEQK